MKKWLKHVGMVMLLWVCAGMLAYGADVKLAWDVVTPAPTGYKVYYGLVAGNYPTVIDAGNILTVTIPNLTVGTKYYFVVRAYNANGESGNSNEVHNFTVVGPTTGPITASTATISWSTDTVADTQVFYGTTTAYGLASVLNPSLVTAHTVMLTGLASGTLYHYKVASKDTLGDGTMAIDYTFTTGTVPNSPANLRMM